ncbi:MAG: oxidoreductase [Pseudohongiella sp.]|nr:MAG: oxidoreductase [Pseudohongiella sp.]
MKDLANRVAIITGSSSGVGAATAKLLAAQGCNVLINYNSNSAGAEAVAAECETLGAECLVMGGSVAEDASCVAMAAAAVEKWGRIDILVNNAGTTKFVEHTDLHGLDSEDFQRIYGVNVIGSYQMVRAVSEQMQAQEEGGAVVNVASTAAVTGIGSSIAYAASKGAMVTMTLSLARALGPKLRINAVCPGFIEGDWLRDGLGDKKYEELIAFHRKNAPLGVTATAETVADAILHFISGPQVVTGETLIVDGGRHLTMTPLGRR